MRKERILGFWLFLLPVLMLSAQSSYQRMWKELEVARQKDLPQTVIRKANDIYEKALVEQNSPQMFRAFLTATSIRKEMDSDSLTIDLERLERWLASTRIKTDQALLHTVLGELYADNGQSVQATEHLKASLEDRDSLLAFDTRQYIPFVLLGEVSNYYIHDFYHLLGKRAIAAYSQLLGVQESKLLRKEILQLFDEMSDTYRQRGNAEAELLLSLDALKWHRQYDFAYVNQQAALEALVHRFSSSPLSVEILLTLAREVSGKDPDRALQLCMQGIRMYPKYGRINVLKELRDQLLQPRFSVQYTLKVHPLDSVRLEVSSKNQTGYTVRLTQHGKKVAAYHYPLTTGLKESRAQHCFPAPALGNYQVDLFPDCKYERSGKEKRPDSLFVSKQKTLVLPIPTDRGTDRQVIVVDALSGKPLEDAPEPWSGDRHYVGYNFRPQKQHTEVKFFTDRSVYRPGQVVSVKGVVYQQEGEQMSVDVQQKIQVRLLDVNRQEVSSQELVTNEFGSFSTTFSLPTSGLTGNYSLVADRASVTFRVENYKRPTFEIRFDSITKNYQEGDTLQITGKARSLRSVLISGKYTYQVYRQSRFIGGARDLTEGVLASGEASLDNEGTFSFPVVLDTMSQPKHSYHRFPSMYRVSVSITSDNNETQTGETLLNGGRSSLLFNLKGNLEQCKESPDSLRAYIQNRQGISQAMQGSFVLKAILNKQEMQRGRFTSGELLPLAWKEIPAGRYQIILMAMDEQGREVKSEDYTLTLYSVSEHRPPKGEMCWSFTQQDEFDVNTPARFLFGTSAKDTYVWMNVFTGNKRLESRMIQLSDSLLHFTVPYKEEYGDGLLYNFVFVKNNEWYQKNIEIKKRISQPKLTLDWCVFRDKLRPGQQEEWRLTVRDEQGRAADAEVLAWMYDSSLDQIHPFRTDWKLNIYRSLPYTRWMTKYTDYQYAWLSGVLRPWKYPTLAYDELDYVRQMWNPKDRLLIAQENGSKIRGVSRSYGKQMNEMSMLDVAEEMQEADVPLTATTDGLRSNFAETAFFYPHLHTNERGEVPMSFTMPESITRWHLLVYAHTKEMQIGSTQGVVRTTRDFALEPSVPRFLRLGDETAVSALVTNFTKMPLKGQVTLQLFDPQTERVLLTRKLPMNIEPDGKELLTFRFKVNVSQTLLACRLTAKSGSFSDGEQHLLPVLSDWEHITEALPVELIGNKQVTLSLKDLFNAQSTTATEKQLTVECTSNPVWMAVMALPSLMEPVSEDALSLATAYYANALSGHLVRTLPQLKMWLEAWKQQPESKEHFSSNLQKNEELKELLLNETPWVMEAQTEAEQKALLLTLFDANRGQALENTLLRKLQGLQLPDGSWPWCRGMEGNVYVTERIATLWVRLSHLTGQPLPTEALAMRNAAFSYLHKHQTGKNPLHYLYLRSRSEEGWPVLPTHTLADYLKNLDKEDIRQRSFVEKAKAALVYRKAGREKEAQEQLASLREYLSQHSTPVDPIVVEAFEELGQKDSALVEQMKVWLLKQKQTQQWKSPAQTADAVYVLLKCGRNLTDEQNTIRFTLGKQVIDSKHSSFPFGYLKEKFTAPDVLAVPGLTVDKQGPGLAWGAVYAQCMEQTNRLKQQQGDLAVHKQVFVERFEDNERRLLLLSPGALLAVGDKVVIRLTLTLKRAMDFIRLKDSYAACFEPGNQLSGYQWHKGAGYYRALSDASTQFFFDRLPKGHYEVEYEGNITRSGIYSTGTATAQSAYASEYVARSAADTLTVR